VGFTMSLFIGSLAFDGADAVFGVQVKMGVLLGSLVSATLAVLLLLAQSRRPSTD
jgi:NhaA family Na+:H+ antiporter